MLNFNAEIPAPTDYDQPAWWFVFSQRKMLVLVNPENRRQITGIPKIKSPDELGIPSTQHNFLGELDGVRCWVAEVEERIELALGQSFVNPRFLFGQVDEPLRRVAFRAIFVNDWDRNNQFCGHCATPMEYGTDRSKKCPSCGLTRYARLSPAVIMMVRKDDKILLGRNKRHPEGFWSVLAGFVDPGESLEETVAREVMEEVGLHVKNITYFGSEAWPFPDSLMLGFMCDYDSGEFVLEDEIVEADWFGPDDFPKNIPTGDISIAGRLIEHFAAELAAK